MENERILVTGGAGYIGSILTRALLEARHAVTVLDNFRFGQTSLIDCCAWDSFRLVRGDCRDEALLREVTRDVDVVIPLAAIVGAPACDADPEAAASTNLGAIRLLVRLLARDQRLLLPVTNSGYGIGEPGAFCTEESPLRPISLYGRTKVAAEEAVLARGDAVSFRLATVFGLSPRMRVELLVNDFVRRAVAGERLVLFEGHFRRNFIHVRDVASAFLHAIDRFETMKDRPYNVGLEEANLTKRELCETIARIVPGFQFEEAAVGEDPDKRDYLVSNARLYGTGWRPAWSLERGIRELVRGYGILGVER
jgi:nucleoside-diphosphate-sugar epimerase